MVRKSGGLHTRGRQRAFERVAFNYSPVILDSDHIPLRISRFSRPLSRSPLPSVAKDDRFRRCVNLARDIGEPRILETILRYKIAQNACNFARAWCFFTRQRRDIVSSGHFQINNSHVLKIRKYAERCMIFPFILNAEAPCVSFEWPFSNQQFSRGFQVLATLHDLSISRVCFSLALSDRCGDATRMVFGE